MGRRLVEHQLSAQALEESTARLKSQVDYLTGRNQQLELATAKASLGPRRPSSTIFCSGSVPPYQERIKPRRKGERRCQPEPQKKPETCLKTLS
jgi:hypothetical protein